MCDKAEAGAYIDAHGMSPWTQQLWKSLKHTYYLDSLDTVGEIHMHLHCMMRAE